jgi:type I restriction enzyme S subunit
MAKLIYDYWFVLFDFPISAKLAARMGKPELEGKPYKSSGGEMVWNEKLKREVPKGWEVGSLLDIAKYINGLACQKFRPIRRPEQQQHLQPRPDLRGAGPDLSHS